MKTTELKVPYCKNCRDLRAGKFCYKCGSELVEGVIQCSNADCSNKNIWPHEKFCQECGTEVRRDGLGKLEGK